MAVCPLFLVKFFIFVDFFRNWCYIIYSTKIKGDYKRYVTVREHEEFC